MFFTEQNLPLPRRPFPFDPHACPLPRQVPDCHLVRTVIPCLPHYDSLGVFHRSASHPLASFARMVSKGNSGNGCGHQSHSGRLLFPAYSLKAGYTAHSTRFCAPPCRFIPGSYAIGVSKELNLYRRRTTPSLHGNRVVYAMPLACARKP